MIYCAYHETYGEGGQRGSSTHFYFDIGLSSVVISRSGLFTDGDKVPGSRSHGRGISVASEKVWASWKREVFLPLLGIEPRFNCYSAHNLDSTPISRELTHIY
jgi:hypothetical protein